MSTFPGNIIPAISDEIDEFMKQSGVFDDMRENLRDGIFNDSKFQDCIRDYKEECKNFCERSDLTEARNILRAKLSSYLDTGTESGLRIRELVRELIKHRSDYIKEIYNTNAIEYLKKFLPKADPDFDHEPQPEEDMDMDESPPMPIETPPTPMDLPPTPPPLPPTPPSPQKQDVTAPEPRSADHQQQQQPEEEPKVNTADNSPPDNNSNPCPIEEDPLAPLFSPISDKESDELEKLTFSSVSSVKTADLSDFDNSINLSDDEADIVGKPANSKVPVSVIADHITNLDTVPEENSNDNAGDNAGRRASRTRKPNHKYSSGEYKLI